MTSYFCDRVPVSGRVAAAVLIVMAVVGAQATAQDDIEAQKAGIVRTALEKLGRPTDNPPLFAAAREADALTEINVTSTDGETRIEITTTGEPVYRYFVLEADNRLVVDFDNTINLLHNKTFEAPESAIVERVRTSLYRLDPQFVSRVVVDMTQLVQMRLDRLDNTVVVHVPEAGVPPSEPVPTAPAESAVVAELQEALSAQQARVAEAEAQLKEETARRVKAEADLQAALDMQATEIAAAIDAERSALAKAREELEAQIAQRTAAEAALRTKLAAAEAELAQAIDEQKAAIAEAEAKLRAEESKRTEAEEQFAETRQELEQQRRALAKLETDLEAARKERDSVEKRLSDQLTAKEAEARAQLDERQRALDALTAQLEQERSAKAALALSLQQETAKKEAAAQQKLDEQKAALAKLAQELEAARARIQAAEKKLEAEEATRAEFETKLAQRARELETMLAERARELEDTRSKLAAEAQARTAVENQYKQQLADARSAAEQKVAELEQTVAELERRLADQQASSTAREQQLRSQLAQREKETDATVAALQKRIEEAERAAAEKERLAKEAEAEKERLAKEAEAEKAAALEEARRAAAEREESLKKQLADRTAAIEQVETELAAVKEQLDARDQLAQAKIDELTEQVAEKEQQIAQMQAEKEAIQRAARQATAEREQLAAQMEAERAAARDETQQAAEVEQLRKKLAAAREEAERAAAEKVRLSREAEAQRAAQIEQLKKELAAAREQLASREQMAQARIDELAAQVTEKEERLAELEALAQKLTAAPPPVPLEEKTITITLRDADLGSVLDILARAANINILAGKGVSGTVTARFTDVPVLKALDIILRDNGYGYAIEDGVYRVVPLDYPHEGMVTEYIRLENADATDVENTLKNLISPTGTVTASKSANAVVIVDLEDNIGRLRKIVQQLDASLKAMPFAPGEAGLATRSYPLSQADALDVRDTIKGLLSPKGTIVANESANLLIVNDRPERLDQIEKLIEQLDVASPVVDVETGMYKLSYARAAEVETILQGILTKDVGSVIADTRSNQVIVTDTPSNFAVIEALIPELDRRVPQVYIEVMMVDAVLNDDAQYGVKWLAEAILKHGHDLKSLSFGTDPSGLSPNLTNVGTPDLLMGSLQPSIDAAMMGFGIIGNDVDLSAIIAAEVQDRDARILATPNVTVLNNQQAVVEIVQEIPFQEMTQTTQGPPVSSTEFKDIGVTLTVTPQITHDGSIMLQLRPEESSISGYSETGIPIEDSRRTQTTLLVDDGATVYIAGLRSISKSLDVSKVPVLGDIPYMGYLFRGTKMSDHRTELLVFVTVHIIEESLPGLTPEEQRKFDEIDTLPTVPDATRDLLHDIADPTGIREPLWRVRRTIKLPRTR